MKPHLLQNILLLLSLPLSSVSQYQHRVAVVGAGIGGAACSYFLHQFAPNTLVDVYEKEDIVGGRLKHVTFGGEVCEVGGDAWSSVCYLAF
jgi:predicted NAD/FAD-binding protein